MAGLHTRVTDKACKQHTQVTYRAELPELLKKIKSGQKTQWRVFYQPSKHRSAYSEEVPAGSEVLALSSAGLV